jgi:hypothetical protein
MDGLHVIERLGGGHLIDEIHAALLDVSEEVVATGKPGSVTITIKVSHPKNADALLVVMDEEVKRSMPKNDPRGAMFYAHETELHERDPRQATLPEFRVVDEGGNKEFRTPDAPEEKAQEG